MFCFGTSWHQAVTGLLLAALQSLVWAQCGSEHGPLRVVLPGVAVHHGWWPARSPEDRPHWATTVVLWQGERAVVLDPGANQCGGLQLQRGLERLAGGTVQVERILVSHAHAEQVLASNAWAVPVAALPGTQAAMRQRCTACLASLTQDLGEAAMAGTRIVLPDHLLHPGQMLSAGGRLWQVLQMPSAHSESDLVLWSAAEGVLLAGGLLDGRGLVLAQGSVAGWLQALARIEALQPRWLIGQHLVAGPGQVRLAIANQRAALCGLVRRSWQGLERWQTEAEALAEHPPEGEAAEQERLRLNLARAWREMEALWLGREAMPAACRD